MTIIEAKFTLKEIGHSIARMKIKQLKPTSIVFKKEKVKGEKFRVKVQRRRQYPIIINH